MAPVKSIPFAPLPGERHLLQLKVTLLDSKPTIWRSLLVPSDMPMADLHECLQICMGWENSHLHHFHREAYGANVYFEPPSEEFFGGYLEEFGTQNVDYTPLVVTDLLSGPNAKLHYEYDFGDSWLHEIVVEQLLPIRAVLNAPCCIDGKMACPPEDCGGIFGYLDMLTTLRKGSKSKRAELLEWLGDDFDPVAFDLEAVNRRLARVAPSKRP